MIFAPNRVTIHSMDKLTRALEALDITDGEFARRIGVSVYAVRKWRAGERTPRDNHKRKIERETGGQVSIMDWYGETGD